MRRLLCNLFGALVLSTGLGGCGGGIDTPARASANPAPVLSAQSQERVLATSLSSTAAVTIHMLGDSTMTTYSADRRPQMGWGEAVPQFFSADVKVNNWALGGRSSRSFYNEATRWPAILPQILAGDYVIIQFAHNDQKSGGDYPAYGTYAFCSDGSTDGEACTGRADKVDPTVDISQHSYYQYLKKYVSDVRARGANPILMAPIVRKYFSGTTITPQGQHNVGIIGGELIARGDYVAAMKAVATRYSVPFVNLTAETKTIVEAYGNASATANLYISADSTHPQVLFANLIAKRAVEGLKSLGILNAYVVPVTSLISSPSTLDWSTRTVNVPSSKPVTLSAFDLLPDSGTVTVSAPANFDLSLDGTTWARNVNVSYTSGAFIQPLQVRFTATALQTYSGNITFALGGTTLATTLAVSGTGVAATGGVASFATWYTSGTSLVPVTDGPVVASDAVVRNLAGTISKVLAVDGQDTTVARYVANAPARDNSQYLQFAVAPAGASFAVNAISAYLTSSGGSTVVADMEYSLNADFSGATRLNAVPLAFTKEVFTKLAFPVAVQVSAGQTLYVRIYPWNSAGVLGKMLAVYGVKVAGSATN
jgi:lysophospholipase L1-like esterase